MKVLVCGASGLIGSAVSRRLEEAGHDVLRGVRRPNRPGEVAIDYSVDLEPSAWLERLHGVDAVVNAVGIIRESPGASFDALHNRAPAALFAACVKAGVRRVVQVSALGAGSGATAYFASKRGADQALAALPLEWTILRPSLVFAVEGASAALFCRLASLPVVPVPALGGARFQPVHLDDLARAVVAALDPAMPARRTVDIAGASNVACDAMLAAYRRAMGLAPAPFCRVPAWAMAGAAWLGGRLRGLPLTPDTWRMLRAGSALAADDRGTAMRELLGNAPMPIDAFVSRAEGELLRLRALASWRGAVLRWALAIVWLATAVVSAFIYPPQASLAMLARVGLEGWPAVLALYGAAALDAVFGIASIVRPRRSLWLAQAALVLGYSALIAVCLPEYLWHPFGPLLKNVPILAILLILFAEEKSWTT